MLLHTRQLGQIDYERCWRAMQAFTDARDETTPDELWWLQHPPVFTQGQAGRVEHLLAPGQIPVVQVDRGGQVTYHGPGQLVGYVLIDLRRRGMGVRALVTAIENAIVALLAGLGVTARPRADAPGVYLDNGAKVAQLGLRVRRGCTFHGLSLNVDMDMEPFQRINPCGHAGLQVSQLAALLPEVPAMADISAGLERELARELGYNRILPMPAGMLPDLLPDMVTTHE